MQAERGPIWQREGNYGKGVLVLVGLALFVGFVFLCGVTWKALYPPKTANVGDAIRSLQAEIMDANSKNPCVPVESATLEISVNATNSSKSSGETDAKAGKDSAGASFSTEAEKVGENSNKLTIELVNTDPREPQPDCRPLGK